MTPREGAPAEAGAPQDQRPGEDGSRFNFTPGVRQTPFKDSAAVYARRGWPVFPCRPGGKTPMTRNGFRDATTDPEVVADWACAAPTANIAAATGVAVDALDVDIRSDGSGFPALDRLNRAGLLAGCVGVAETRNGGFHLFFPPSGRGCGSLSGHRLDFKALGGYVLLPPSVVPADPGTPGTGRYSWAEEFDGSAAHAKPLDWDACRRLLLPAPSVRRHGAGTGRTSEPKQLLGWLSKQPEGSRNRALFWAACRWFEQDHGDPAPLIETARTLGLDRVETAKTIGSARQRVGAE